MVCLWSYHLYVQSQSTMKNYTRLNGWSACGVITYMSIIIIIIINPLTVRVVGAPQMILQPAFSISPCSPLPLGPAELYVCPSPDAVFPPLPLSALSSSPFHCALQDGFGQT